MTRDHFDGAVGLPQVSGACNTLAQWKGQFKLRYAAVNGLLLCLDRRFVYQNIENGDRKE